MFGATMLMMVAAATSQSLPNEYGESDNWLITRSDGACTMTSFFPRNQTRFDVVYDFPHDTATLLITSSTFKSVEHKKIYRLRPYFVRNNLPFGRRDEQDSFGVITSTGVKGFTLRFRGSQFLSDFAQSSIFAVLRGDIVAISLKLDGSAKAIKMLEDCARDESRRNPPDPFAD